MKIIRRRRIVTIETCAYRRWQTTGSEESFSCPNCGKVFDQISQKTDETLPADVIAGILAESNEVDSPEQEKDGMPQPCGEVCIDTQEEK